MTSWWNRSAALVAVALTAAAAAFAQAPPRVAVVEVRVPDDAAAARLEAAGLPVARVRGGLAEVYVLEERLGALRELGLPWRVTAWQPGGLAKGVDGYHDYGEVTAALSAWAETYPDLCRLTSAGQSMGARELWVLRITDHPDLEEDEPEFKYIATIHGDEPVGTELCLAFIARLLADYGTDPRITTLVNGTDLSVMPLMNPDGRMAGTRFNLAGVDLNRSFPGYPVDFQSTLFDGEALGDSFCPVEVGHVMRWTAAESFVLSANFHTGATVVNYPYDNMPGVASGQPAYTPDEPLLAALALVYASRNPVMSASREFPDGIVNGSDWYSITGGMQDWHYRYLGCVDMTIELSDVKWPDDSTLPGFEDDNGEAMLAYAEAVRRGVRGVVTERNTGLPLWAQLRVSGNAQRVYTDPDVGDYHRLLLPGTYDLEVWAPGYIPRLVSGVTVGADGAARRDVALSDGDLDGNGWVEAADIQAAVAAVLQRPGAVDADVDGGGVSVTDVQHIINIALGLPPAPRPAGW